MFEMRVRKSLENVFAQSISKHAKLVYCYLLSTTKGGTSQPSRSSREEISFYCGISEKTVINAIKELIEAELIEERRLGQGNPNSISITNPENFINRRRNRGN